MSRHAAIDLGASSGRVVVGEVGPDVLAWEAVHRFPNEPVHRGTELHWDITGLYRQAVKGLAAAGRLDTIGIDSWAIDYGLLDASGQLVDEPFHYRDRRTEGVAERLQTRLSAAEIYQRNGLQHLPFTTLYQLATPQPAASSLLLIPDLLTFWLTGTRGAELTNASTTGLLDVRTQRWSDELLALVGLDRQLLPPLRFPGEQVGPLLPSVCDQVGSAPTVVAVGSHDTASAFVAVPMEPDRAVVVSLGTWGLVGVELEAPVLTEESRLANFTNELGVDGRVRYLRNVMGLWLLQECLREWGLAAGSLPELLREAAALPTQPGFDVDDPRLLAPGDMPERLCQLIEEGGCRRPRRRAHLVRHVVDSLAEALARTVADAARLSGRRPEVVHVVGGGAQNGLLCQLLANATGLPVTAGPVEATALGNLLVQARAHGTLTGDLEQLRALVRATHQVTRFEPQS